MTLGLSIVIENVLLYFFRGDTRTIDTPYGFSVISLRGSFLAVHAWSDSSRSLLSRRRYGPFELTDTGKAIPRGEGKDWGAACRHRRRSHLRGHIGLGPACVDRRVPADPVLYGNPHVGNAFVLVAFTIVVLGGMGSVPGALIGGLFIGVIESLCGFIHRRVARADRHLPAVHPGAAVPPDRPFRRARMSKRGFPFLV